MDAGVACISDSRAFDAVPVFGGMEFAVHGAEGKAELPFSDRR